MKNSPLSFDRAFWHSPSIHVAMRASIRGHFSDDQFRQALHLASLRHPYLGARLEMNKSGELCFVEGACPVIPVHFQDQAGPEHWRHWLQEQDAIPFDFERGPLVRVAVLRHESSCDLVLLGHHILGDGMAWWILTRDLVGFLNGDPAGPVLRPPLLFQETKLPPQARLSCLHRFLLDRLNKAWRKNPQHFSDYDFKAFFNFFRHHNPAGLFLGSLDRASSQAFFTTCRAQGVTVNDALVTALVEAIRHLQASAPAELELGIAINVRAELQPPVGDCLGNYVSGVLCQIGYNPKLDFFANVRQTREMLQLKMAHHRTRFGALSLAQALDPALVDSLCFAEYGNFANPISRRVARLAGERDTDKSIGMSNLGRIDHDSAGLPHCLQDVQFIQPAFPANRLTLAVITFNGHLNFCLRYFTNLISDELAEAIFQRMSLQIRGV